MTTRYGDNRTREELLDEIEQLRYRLDEAEQTLEAIRSGEVDALVVAGPHGDQIFSLTGSERFYRQVVETMNEGALTVSLDGIILYCNQRFCSLLRCSMADVLSRNWADFTPPAQLPQLKLFLDNAQTAPVQQLFHLRAADGTNVPVNIAASMLVAETDNSICLVVSDLSALEDQSSSIKDLLKQKYTMEAHQAELHAINEELRNSQRAALNLVEDVEIARRKAEESNQELQQEILVRRQAEEAVRESERKYSILFDTLAVAASLTKLPEIVFSDVNKAFEKLFGYTREEVVGKTSLELGITRPEEQKVTSDELERQGRQFDAEKCVFTKSGEERIVLINVIALELGGQSYTLTTIQDITERKRAEEALQKAHMELALQMEERVRELQEKEVLLKEVHHRVKNNLQVISSLVSLQADGSPDEIVREVLRDVTYRVRSMALVHEKLYHSATLSSVDFAEYAQSLLSYLWRAHGSAAASVRLSLELEPVSFPIDIAVPCGLILNELAGNALKHAFRGRDEGEVTVSLHINAECQVCLGVKDDGVGMPPELDWRQAKSLGLRLVQMLAGQLRAFVEVDRLSGTEFLITFNLPQKAKDGESEYE